MDVIILCGGKGSRLGEETELKPKPMVEIGGKPILWHIMKYYSFYGYNRFILPLGYKGSMIMDYFKSKSSKNIIPNSSKTIKNIRSKKFIYGISFGKEYDFI